MSTHAFVGKYTKDGVVGQYINFDGYPAYTGRLLVQHHNSAAEVDGLIENLKFKPRRKKPRGLRPLTRANNNDHGLPFLVLP